MPTSPPSRLYLLLPLLPLLALTLLTHHSTPVQAASPEPLQNPDQLCAQCHQAIYQKYEQTAMARGSGPAAANLIPGQFHHKPSAIDYTITLSDNVPYLTYSRPASNPKGALSGQQRLELYIGSGHRGRTYLFSNSGLWYELPINFYTRRNTWDMAPAFDNATTMPAPLPVDPNCLHCHATDIQPSLPDARNHFTSIPFRQGGIGCSACHGDPTQHLAQNGHGTITNPAKLNIPQRDSACIQCHLEGDAVVYRPNRSLSQFIPGDNLSDIAIYFVRASQQSGGSRATSQYEALLRSACKRAAGDKLTCTTCHDPHSDPSPTERVQYFRNRCLACHTAPAMAQHHPDQPDCAHCHMPTRSTVDISHEQVTDHDIEARPSNLHLAALGEAELVPVGNFPATDRETGLAYAQLAQRGDHAAAVTALRLLAKLPPSPQPDVELSVRLGYLQQITGDPIKARASYIAALQSNPWEPTALANLAVLDAASNHLPEAIHLLQRLTNADPAQTAAGLNLAFIQCSLNHREEALQLLHRLQTANPDDPQLRLFLQSGNYANQHCTLTTKPQ